MKIREITCSYLYFTCFQAPRRMTEPNEEELEPLVIEPRPEILQASPGGQTREENKPTTICLICGHVLFKKVTIAIVLHSGADRLMAP